MNIAHDNYFVTRLFYSGNVPRRTLDGFLLISVISVCGISHIFTTALSKATASWWSLKGFHLKSVTLAPFSTVGGVVVTRPGLESCKSKKIRLKHVLCAFAVGWITQLLTGSRFEQKLFYVGKQAVQYIRMQSALYKWLQRPFHINICCDEANRTYPRPGSGIQKPTVSWQKTNL